ncbi:hypothetical protein OTBS_1192 [Orientia tsutsugamushi str. Boryong]|uniref:Uncharacterized protein n=1 Tax=Orientia tsutsugamushi (strain Boryong) TaxID=357244 RepID=A5CE33_ORITB|nr:hypothetical protein OTBS_1192 [Orientia tsutsugamushi str. Boryong]
MIMLYNTCLSQISFKNQDYFLIPAISCLSIFINLYNVPLLGSYLIAKSKFTITSWCCPNLYKQTPLLQ